ncbi:hypothetical protein BS50DRAFT_264402 [Corynespora cassiicola Philippines]|uniref:Uncharacterized protein n=1 Tax=Corynespora cassiicola Philippines TaxID=1448308 RepID=A0A2T2NYU9_CORCC|nr:hypothetical protein BS50DRAFT_264402 [Corynespora cassiicola Philippines]
MRDLTKLADVTYAWGPIAIWYMAEIYVLIIAGTIPTLKPIWSKIQGQIPSVTSYARYKDRSSKYPYDSSTGGADNTVGSKTSKGLGSQGRPGDVTIALNEIDNITRAGTSGSLESILQRVQSPTGPSTTTTSVNEQPPSSQGNPERSQNPTIVVERKFSISYHETKTTGPDCRFP